jgi:hypothetical protein
MTRKIVRYESPALSKTIPDAMLLANEVTSLLTSIARHFTILAKWGLPIGRPQVDGRVAVQESVLNFPLFGMEPTPPPDPSNSTCLHIWSDRKAEPTSSFVRMTMPAIPRCPRSTLSSETRCEKDGPLRALPGIVHTRFPPLIASMTSYGQK